jgi:hypothetical protein
LSSRLLSKNVKIRIYKTVIPPLVLYGYEAWSLILKAGHRLRVSENRLLRRIFRSKRAEVSGDWRKLHNEELHNLYPLASVIIMIKSRMRWARYVLGRPRRRWVDNVKIDLREIEWGGMDWIDLAQDRDQWRALVNTVMNLEFHNGRLLKKSSSHGVN